MDEVFSCLQSERQCLHLVALKRIACFLSSCLRAECELGVETQQASRRESPLLSAGSLLICFTFPTLFHISPFFHDFAVVSSWSLSCKWSSCLQPTQMLLYLSSSCSNSFSISFSVFSSLAIILIFFYCISSLLNQILWFGFLSCHVYFSLHCVVTKLVACTSASVSTALVTRSSYAVTWTLQEAVPSCFTLCLHLFRLPLWLYPKKFFPRKHIPDGPSWSHVSFEAFKDF